MRNIPLRLAAPALLASTILLASCTTVNDGVGSIANDVGQVLNDRPSGPAPVRDPYPGQPFPGHPGATPAFYHATGQEPGWTLDIDQRAIRFSGAYGQSPLLQPTPPAIHAFAGDIYRTPRINVNIIHGQCRDAMNGRAYPDQIQLNVDGRDYRGCGGPSAAYVGQQGAANPPAPNDQFASNGPLADSRWRIVSINGRSTPATSGYHVEFTGDRISAKFGCNNMGGAYLLDRDMLSTDRMMGTKMACTDPAGRFESLGSAILASPTRTRFAPGRLTLTNNAGIIELERR